MTAENLFKNSRWPLTILGVVSAVLYLGLFFNMTIFGLKYYQLTMLILWGSYASYFLGWLVLTNAPRLQSATRLVVLFAIIFYAIMFFVVPSTDSDFYHYYFEDSIWVNYNLNPYQVAPDDLPFAQESQLTHWPALAAQHGPARLLVMAPAAWLGFGHFWLALFWYKIIFLIVTAGLIYFVVKLSSKISKENPGRIIFLVAWNPLILHEAMTISGTDILMMTFFLGALVFLSENRKYLSGLFFCLSIMVKYITILAAPFVIWYIYRRYSGWQAICYLIILFMGIVLLFFPFWIGPQTLSSLFYVASYFETNSLTGLLYIYLNFFGVGLNSQTWLMGVNLLFLGVYSWLWVLMVAKRRDRFLDLLVWCLLGFVFFLLIAKIWFYVKYLIWVIPLLVILGRKTELVAIFVTGLAVFGLLVTAVFPLLFLPPILTIGGYWVAKKHLQLA